MLLMFNFRGSTTSGAVQLQEQYLARRICLEPMRCPVEYTYEVIRHYRSNSIFEGVQKQAFLSKEHGDKRMWVLAA